MPATYTVYHAVGILSNVICGHRYARARKERIKHENQNKIKRPAADRGSPKAAFSIAAKGKNQAKQSGSSLSLCVPNSQRY